jgi:hypothetical protein
VSMSFISDGDFSFPFEAYYYNIKHLFIWSYQSGAANPDGIIRLPGRVLYLAVFSLFGNINVAYFFLLSSLLVVFASFYYFCTVFLYKVGPAISVLCALFFTLNPIFLGNIAKIGLVVAAAMLPPSLAVINRAFERKRLRYLLLWLLFMNISLIHPFTFTVNFLVSGAYFLYQCHVHRAFAKHHIGHFILIGAAAILMNAYFILPLASMGTVSKDALSSNVSTNSPPTNYTSLVDVANTGDIFTGLSLSKNVLKDFEFYNPVYQNFYFLGVFVIYIVLLGIYLHVEDRISLVDKKRFGVFLASFLVLILLATVKLWHVDNLIKFVIGLPGGWMFRSPLKWQLYIPLVLFSMLAMVLVHVTSSWHRRALYISLGFSFLLMNGFLVASIYHDLLKPREIHSFHALSALSIDHQNLLMVGSDRCFTFADTHPEVMTELNQVLISKQVQVKQVSIGDLDTVNLASYSYVLGCQNTISTVTTDGYQLKLQQQFVDSAFQLYKNEHSLPYLYTSADILGLNQPRSINSTAIFARSILDKPFITTETTSKAKDGTLEAAIAPAVSEHTTGVQDLFDKLDFGGLKNGKISTSITPVHSGKQTLYIQQNSTLYYKQTGNELALSTTQRNGFQRLQSTTQSDNNGSHGALEHKLEVNLEAGKDLSITYQDPAYSYINLIGNSSLENGLWQKSVGDCYAYDNQPDIAMDVVTNDSTEGKNSLRLKARNHIACTGPSEVAVKSAQHYLLSFDYKNLGGPYGGYYINFNDPKQTVLNGRLKVGNNTWETFTKNITIPEGATRMRVIVYSYPDGTGTTYGSALYDRFQLTTIPDVQGKFHLVGAPKQVLVQPKSMDFANENPAKSTIRITGASTPFFLGSHESYNANWQLSALHNTAVLSDTAANHFRLNTSMNGWFIDPIAVCKTLGPASSDCTRNPDGSYNLVLAMSFKSQRLVYVGGLVTSVTFLGMLTYFVIDYHKDKHARRFWIAKTFGRKRS